MYRIWSAKAAIVRRNPSVRIKTPFLLAAIALLAFALPSFAQTGGQGALEGTVTDPTGAVVPNATITATEQAGKDKATRNSSGAGLYTITPLVPGVYTVTVAAPGFETLTQKNIEVNGLSVTGLNLTLTIGSADQSVTVTEAPPQLQTTSPSVEAVITQDTYESLPIIMNNQQRDPSSLATLAPGTQGGSRAPLFAGTGNYLSEVYVDGLPTTTSNQQSDNRIVSNGIPVESVEQLQIISSGPSAEYQGAGAIGFTIKSGGNQYHGQEVIFVRNTIFDTWGFAGNQATYTSTVNGVTTTIPAGKPVEHQNEISASVGGPIKFTRGKGYFFFNYDRFHGRTGVTPVQYTVPTTPMTAGDFTDLNAYFAVGGPNGTMAQQTAYHDSTQLSGAFLYDPTSNVCVTASNCARTPYKGMHNGLPSYNVIPTGVLSAISLKQQSFLPAPNLPGITNNFQNTGISGYDNHEYLFNIAFDITKAQRINVIVAHGVRANVGYGGNLPLPYTEGDLSLISPTIINFEHTITLSSNKVNQFKYGFTRFPQPVIAPTGNAGQGNFSATTMGITGLPVGQASANFPCSQFVGAGLFPNSTITNNSAGASVQSEWTQCGASDASHNVVPNAFTIVDNFQWSKGKHAMTFGLQTQWLEDNTASQTTPSGIYTQAWNPISTANFGTNSNTLSSATTGYAYASFLIGAVNSAATSVPLFVETAGRFHNYSPYFQDDWKIRANLTVNLGLRWDYFPPYHEALDRWSFFNPSLVNPITNTAGELQYAGNPGTGLGCNCRTPVNTYWKNIGPRLGAEWAVDPKTVFRAGFAIAYSKAGGVGGRAGDSTGAGQNGFGSSIVLNPAVNTGVGAAPSFYLNPNLAYTNPTGDAFTNAPNTNFGGPGYVIPPPTPPNAAGLVLGIGNNLTGSTYSVGTGAPAYADPYLSGRAPEFVFYNFGMQKALTKDITLTLQYSGSQSHFVAGAGVPGFWSGQLNPNYLVTYGSTVGSDGVTNILGLAANPANVALAQANGTGYTLPYAGYQQAAGGTNTTGSIARALRPFPQYSSPPSPEWDNIANISYNAFELVLAQRQFKGISYTVNYTYSRNVGDDGTTRSAFAVPAAASSSGVPLPGNNRADRDLVATDLPENLNIYGVVKSPFGKGKIGTDNFAVRQLLGGWQAAGIFTYASGTPLLITGTGCTAPSQGTCMPDLVPGRSKDSLRINGGYGAPGVTYANYKATPHVDSSAFQAIGYFPLSAASIAAGAAPITKIGSAPRSDLNLWSPSHYNLDSALQRAFNLTPRSERYQFIFRADCFDTTNKVTFSMSQGQSVIAYTPPAKINNAYTAASYTAPGTPNPPAPPSATSPASAETVASSSPAASSSNPTQTKPGGMSTPHPARRHFGSL